MSKRYHQGLALLSGCGLLAAAAASATPITYDLMNASGSNVELFASNANNGNTLLAGGMLMMTAGSLVEFDPSALTLPQQDYNDAGPTTLALAGALAGDSLKITNFTVAPTTGYSSAVSSSGANAYNFTSGDLLATGTWQLLNSTGNPVSGQSGSFNHVVPTFNGQFAMSGNELQNLTLTGISLGQVTIEGTPVNVSADVTFTGMQAVPLPTPLGLLGSALLGLAFLAWRQRADGGQSAAGLVPC